MRIVGRAAPYRSGQGAEVEAESRNPSSRRRYCDLVQRQNRLCIEAAALSGEFSELAPQTRRVVIDLSSVEMIDAAGLGALISVALTAQASQCSVKLAASGNLILELLELTKLTSVFEVHPTLDAATVASREQAA